MDMIRPPESTALRVDTNRLIFVIRLSPVEALHDESARVSDEYSLHTLPQGLGSLCHDKSRSDSFVIEFEHFPRTIWQL